MILHRSHSPEAGRPRKLVLLDVDGTIFSDSPNEFTGVAYDYLIQNNLLNPGSAPEVDEILSLRERYALNEDLTERRKYFDPLNKAFDKQIAGRSRTSVDRMADNIVEKRLEEAFPAVLSEIKEHQEYGNYIGLISGSPNFLIQALKRAIGADIATGTRFFSSGGGVYHPTRGTDPRGRNKDKIAESMLIDLSQQRLKDIGRGATLQARRVATLDEFDPADRFELASGYGDTIHDESMMRMSYEPVAVQPKPELRAIAIAENWRIIDQP